MFLWIILASNSNQCRNFFAKYTRLSSSKMNHIFHQLSFFLLCQVSRVLYFRFFWEMFQDLFQQINLSCSFFWICFARFFLFLFDGHKRNRSTWVYKRDKWKDTKPDQTRYFMTSCLAHIHCVQVVFNLLLIILPYRLSHDRWNIKWTKSIFGGARTPQHFSITAYHSPLSTGSPINFVHLTFNLSRLSL